MAEKDHAEPRYPSVHISTRSADTKYIHPNCTLYFFLYT